jgi:hypothetical protein
MGKILTVRERLEALLRGDAIRKGSWPGEWVKFRNADTGSPPFPKDVLDPGLAWELYELPAPAESEYEDVPVDAKVSCIRVRLPGGEGGYWPFTDPAVMSDRRFSGYVHVDARGHKHINTNCPYAFHFRDGTVCFPSIRTIEPGVWKPASFIRWRKE